MQAERSCPIFFSSLARKGIAAGEVLLSSSFSPGMLSTRRAEPDTPTVTTGRGPASVAPGCREMRFIICDFQHRFFGKRWKMVSTKKGGKGRL